MSSGAGSLKVAVLCCLGFAAFNGTLLGQDRTNLDEELKRIFEAKEYEAKSFGPSKWLDDGESYTTLESSESMRNAEDIVRYESASGEREVLIDASRLVPEGESDALEIDDYVWSADRKRLLVFTNTQRVWRRNTRGDYWVLHLASGKLQKLGRDAEPSTLMFAKFSPDGSRVAYVCRNDIYVEDLTTGKITALTNDGSENIIHGTSDWVYEEELGVRDGFRWSPDGTHIAYWSFDSTGVGKFALINNTDSLYPEITYIPYPKVGTNNSSVRIGVVSAGGGETRWMEAPGDPRNTYIARMEWIDERSLVMQQLNRLQNTNDVLLADTQSGRVKRAHRDQSDTWVELFDGVAWLNGKQEFLWLSEKDGFRHAYRVERNGSGEQLITRFSGDVTGVLGINGAETWLYFMASPRDATQRYLFRSRLDGIGEPERLTPSDQPGTHSYDLSPDGRWALRTYSRFEMPPRIDLVSLPEHRSVRVLVDNSDLETKAGHLLIPPAEFFNVNIGDVWLDAWMIKPRDFDPDGKYPLLVFVYGEPAAQTVLDRWGGSRMLFHRALANEGFVIVSMDNRGTPAPRGVAWRKMVYGTIGDLSSRDQAAGVRALVEKYAFIDGLRVAVWGWSGGGSSALNCMFRFPDVFKVGVSVAPVPDQRLYDTIYQERYMGLPKDNAEGYRTGSPINFAEGLEGRLLIIHGTGDDNVHYQGTERLVNRLIELGKSFNLMIYPNRSHAIREGEGTQLHVYSLIARYILEAWW